MVLTTGWRRCLSLPLTLLLATGNAPRSIADSVDQSPAAAAVQPAEPTPAQLQQLVAPIALHFNLVLGVKLSLQDVAGKDEKSASSRSCSNCELL